MTVWKYVLAAVPLLAMMIVGLALGDRFDLEWLRIATLVVTPVLAGTGVMIIKTRNQRHSRSMEPGSVEREADVRARADAFVDALVLTAVALALSTIFPHITNWVLPLALLSGFAVSYWLRRALDGRDARREQSP